MIRIFQVGLIAVCFQSISVVVITCTFMLVAWRATTIPGPLGEHQGSVNFTEWMDGHSILLRYSYFLIAIGLILTRNKFTDLTAENIRQVAIWVQPITPKRELEAIFYQLLVATICFGVATVQAPSSSFIAILGSSGSSWIPAAIWSGAMSVILAAFGATVVAARKAM